MQKRPPRTKKTLGSTAIQDALCETFPSEWLEKTAKETGLVKRLRKIDPVAFFWTLVLSYGVETQRCLASMKRDYQRQTRMTLSDGSWYDRFSPALVLFLKACVEHGIAEAGSDRRRELSERLKRFDDVLIQDSTIIRLHEKLAKHWPATRSTKVAAGVKVAMLVSAVANGPKSVAIHGERTSEISTLRVGPWMKNRVLLVDLGFYKHHLFARIAENGGYFVSRLKDNADPLIQNVLSAHSCNAIDLAGMKWSQARASMKREALDAEVEINFSRRAYLATARQDSITVRLVAIRDEETGEYHAYVTNIPPETLTTEEVAALYGMRWEVELVFKELKSRYAIDKIKTTNPRVVEALIWIGILTMLASRRVHHVIRRTQSQKLVARFTTLRWATVFMENASRLLTAVLTHLGINQTFELIADVYTCGALNPHVSRQAFTAGSWA